MSTDNEESTFLAEAEVMDLSPIRDKTFSIAVSTGNPNGCKFLCSTIHGPYSFIEMLQEVGQMWEEHQHHAKAIVLEKDSKVKVKFLDENTVDYIEAHFADLMIEETLRTFDDKEFTCTAGTVEQEEAEKVGREAK